MEPDSPSFFNEREISVLLKRAAEIQGADGPASAFGLGVILYVRASGGESPPWIMIALVVGLIAVGLLPFLMKKNT